MADTFTYTVWAGGEDLGLDERDGTYKSTIIPFVTKSGTCTFTQKKKKTYGVIYHEPSKPAFVLASDEYPTKLVYYKDEYDAVFQNYNTWGSEAYGTLYLSDENGENAVEYTDCTCGKYDGSHAVSSWQLNYATGTFTIKNAENLTGKQLCIKLTGDSSIAMSHAYKMGITTKYVTNKKITIAASTGDYAKDQTVFLQKGSPVMNGSKYASSVTAARGTTVTIKGIPSVAGHQLTSIKASKGTNPVKNSDGTFTFTMPTPADNITLTPVWSLASNAVTIVSSPVGVGTGSCKVDGKTVTKADYGDTVVLSQTLSDLEYKFDKWTLSTGKLNSDGESFSMPASAVTATTNYTQRTLTFKDSSFTTSQDEYVLTVTRKADAVDSFGSEIIYYLYKNGISVAQFESGSKSVSIVLSDAEVNSFPKPEINLKIVAKSMNLNDKAKIKNLETQLKEAVSGTEEYDSIQESLVAARAEARYIEAHGVVQTLNADDVYKTVDYYTKGQYQRCIMYCCVDGETYYTNSIADLTAKKNNEEDEVKRQALEIEIASLTLELNKGREKYNLTGEPFLAFAEVWPYIWIKDSNGTYGWQLCSTI